MTSRPLRLTDDELNSVFAAARPLAVNRRDDFLQAVAASLRRCDVIGPGVVHRICAQVQREHFDPPALERSRLEPLGPRRAAI
jgi:hypothetical protein